jgi:hypothetical protein
MNNMRDIQFIYIPVFPKNNYEYTILRLQKNVLKSTIGKRLSIYPDLKIILDIVNPNARTLWKNIKLRLKKKINCKYSGFDLDDDYTQKKLIEDIKKIHNERMKHELESDEESDD